MDYVQANGVHFTYWSLNPNSGDTGGILDDDWSTENTAKMDLLRNYQAPLLEVNRPTLINRQSVPGRSVAPRTATAAP